MDLITREKTKEYLKEWLDDPDIYPLYYKQACEIVDEAVDDVPAEFTMAIDYQKKEESDRTIYYQKKEESDDEKINKEIARRILERRKMCIEKVANDTCQDDCSLCNFCVSTKFLLELWSMP